MRPTAHAPIPVIELGGTHVTAALVDAAAGKVPVRTRHQRPLDAEAAADVLLDAVLGCAAELEAGEGASWGVAVPGPFDYERGIAQFSGVAKFDALKGLDLRRALLAGLPSRPGRITFLNDAHAFTLGEWVAGSARGHARTVGVTLGTGIGSAFLADGSVVDEGPDVPPHGHVHLLTIAGRPLEETVSRRALRLRFAETTGAGRDAPADVRDIARLARSGHEDARRVLDDAFFSLGEALGPWLARFRATAVVVGGSVAGSWDLIAAPLRAGVDGAAGDGTRGTVLTCARHLQDAALLGAARYAIGEREPPESAGASQD